MHAMEESRFLRFREGETFAYRSARHLKRPKNLYTCTHAQSQPKLKTKAKNNNDLKLLLTDFHIQKEDKRKQYQIPYFVLMIEILPNVISLSCLYPKFHTRYHFQISLYLSSFHRN